MKYAVSTFATVALMGLLPSATPAQRASSVLVSCKLDRVEGQALCGTLSVPERRERPESRRIDLNVVVLPATDRRSLPDPLVFLAGGGVLPATRLAPFLSRSMADLRRSRDIVLVDQRGTGGSNSLACQLEHPPPRDAGPDTAEIRKRVNGCVAEIETHADVQAYSTTRAMLDLEEVRSWLGYDQLNLWGMSYGTKAAREYLRLYPKNVRSLVLSGVVPRAVPWWGDQAANAETTLRVYYRLCHDDPPCRQAFPNPRESLDTLLLMLRREPALVGDSVRITATAVRSVLYERLAESSSAVTIPLLVRLALDGDFTAFLPARQAGPAPIPRGIFHGIVCSEELRRNSAPAIRASAEGSFLGPIGALQLLAVCAVWPTWPIEPGLWEEVRSDVPTLILNGALDHITPVVYAERVAALLPRSRLLVAPLRGHNDFDPCLGQLIQRFVQRPDSGGVDASCLVNTAALRFPTTKGELPGR